VGLPDTDTMISELGDLRRLAAWQLMREEAG
jgi:hypothetical protein